MPIDKFKTRGTAQDKTLFVLRDPDYRYTHSEVCDLLEKAEQLGFELDAGCYLENLTVRELDILVNLKQ